MVFTPGILRMVLDWNAWDPTAPDESFEDNSSPFYGDSMTASASSSGSATTTTTTSAPLNDAEDEDAKGDAPTSPLTGSVPYSVSSTVPSAVSVPVTSSAPSALHYTLDIAPIPSLSSTKSPRNTPGFMRAYTPRARSRLFLRVSAAYCHTLLSCAPDSPYPLLPSFLLFFLQEAMWNRLVQCIQSPHILLARSGIVLLSLLLQRYRLIGSTTRRYLEAVKPTLQDIAESHWSDAIRRQATEALTIIQMCLDRYAESGATHARALFRERSPDSPTQAAAANTLNRYSRASHPRHPPPRILNPMRSSPGPSRLIARSATPPVAAVSSLKATSEAGAALGPTAAAASGAGSSSHGLPDPGDVIVSSNPTTGQQQGPPPLMVDTFLNAKETFTATAASASNGNSHHSSLCLN